MSGALEMERSHISHTFLHPGNTGTLQTEPCVYSLLLGCLETAGSFTGLDGGKKKVVCEGGANRRLVLRMLSVPFVMSQRTDSNV